MRMRKKPEFKLGIRIICTLNCEDAVYKRNCFQEEDCENNSNFGRVSWSCLFSVKEMKFYANRDMELEYIRKFI